MRPRAAVERFSSCTDRSIDIFALSLRDAYVQLLRSGSDHIERCVARGRRPFTIDKEMQGVSKWWIPKDTHDHALLQFPSTAVQKTDAGSHPAWLRTVPY